MTRGKLGCAQLSADHEVEDLSSGEVAKRREERTDG